MSVKCVLFDFDGVIADTERHTADYFAAVLAKHGVILTEEDRKDLIGRNDDTLRRQLISRANDGLTLEQLAEERKQYGTYYENGNDLAPMPGLLEFIRFLKEAGMKIGVVSSTRTQLIIVALNRMKMMDLFDVIVCGDMVRQTKPAPDSYQKAMQFLGMTPAECIAIEDSPTGIQAAQNAEMNVIAFKGSEIQQNTDAAQYQAFSYEECVHILEQYKI